MLKMNLYYLAQLFNLHYFIHNLIIFNSIIKIFEIFSHCINSKAIFDLNIYLSFQKNNFKKKKLRLPITIARRKSKHLIYKFLKICDIDSGKLNF